MRTLRILSAVLLLGAAVAAPVTEASPESRERELRAVADAGQGRAVVERRLSDAAAQAPAPTVSRAEETEGGDEAEAGSPLGRLLALAAIRAAVCALAALVMLVLACRYWEVDMLVSGYLFCGVACGLALFAAAIVSDLLFPAFFGVVELTLKGKLLVATCFFAPTLVVMLQRCSFSRDLGASVRVALATSVWSFFALLALNHVLAGAAFALLNAS